MDNKRIDVGYDKLPDWLRHGLRAEYEATIDGLRWVTDGHIAIRVAGQASLLGAGRIGELLASKGVQNATTRLSLGAAVLEGSGAGHEPGITECEDCGEWFGLGDGRGSMVGHYFVPMGADGIRLSLCYAAVIPYLFGEVEWFGSGPRDPVVVKVGGEVVAVVMPAPKAS